MERLHNVQFYDVTETNLLFTVDCNYYSYKDNTKPSINFSGNDTTYNVHLNEQFYVADTRFETSDCGIYSCSEINSYNHVLLEKNP